MYNLLLKMLKRWPVIYNQKDSIATISRLELPNLNFPALRKFKVVYAMTYFLQTQRCSPITIFIASVQMSSTISTDSNIYT